MSPLLKFRFWAEFFTPKLYLGRPPTGTTIIQQAPPTPPPLQPIPPIPADLVARRTQLKFEEENLREEAERESKISTRFNLIPGRRQILSRATTRLTSPISLTSTGAAINGQKRKTLG